MKAVASLGVAVFCLSGVVSPLVAQQEPSSDGADPRQAKYEKFEQMLSGVKLIGRFTVIGREQRDPAEEQYTIRSVKKLEEGDYWMFAARIKYGQYDFTVPLKLQVKWAGDTPMITLSDLQILNMGPFSARVLFADGKYAGTWSHGKAGGHMFGRIEKIKDNGERDGTASQ